MGTLEQSSIHPESHLVRPVWLNRFALRVIIMKLCPGVWCPSTIFLATLSFLFLLTLGLFLSFLSLNLFVNIPIHDIGDVTSIKADHIDESNDGKLVYLTGDTTTDDLATDPLFGVVVSDVIKLRRVVEKFEGKDKGWSNTTSPLNQTFVPKPVKLGAFTLSSSLIDKMSNFQHLPMTLEIFEQIPDNLSIQLGGQLHFYNDNYYVGQNPSRPQFGDLRISFLMVSTGTVSVIAKQVGSGLVSDQTQTERLKSGVASLEEIISDHKNISVKIYYFSSFYKRLPLYFLGLFTLSFGMYLIFLMLKVLNNFPPAWTLGVSLTGFFVIFLELLLFLIVLMLDKDVRVYMANNIWETIMVTIISFVVPSAIYIFLLLLSKLLKGVPFFDSITKWFNWLSALIISISLFLIIIASIWISYLPILGVTLIIMAVGNLYFLKPAHRLLTPLNFEPPEEPTLLQETVVPQKT